MSESRARVVPLVVAVALVAGAVGWYVASNTQEVDPRLRLNEPAPRFELAPLDGGPNVTLDQLRGKVVYVNLWATWCGPCREEAPSLQRLYAALHGEGFEIVSATIDTDLEKVRAFQKEFGIAYPIVLDPDQQAYRAYGATAVPETYLVDQQGRLAEAYIGPRNWDDPRYARAIRRLLAAEKG